MAAVKHVQIAPHLYCGPIVAAANIQLAAATSNFLIIEMIDKMDGFHAELLSSKIEIDKGRVLILTAPGLGVELDEEVARAHPYHGDQLHLEMGQTLFDPARNRHFAGG